MAIIGPQYQDWAFGSNDTKWRARCPELDKYRTLWEDGKARWKSMSMKEKRASKNAGPSGLWAKSRMWKAEGERVKRACKDTWRQENRQDFMNVLTGGGGSQGPSMPAMPAMPVAQFQPSSQSEPAAGPSPVLLVGGAVGILAIIGVGAYIILQD